MIEVMIVLGVTTAMFASASLLVSGRQSRVGFTQAVGELRGSLEQAINQVRSGYYADTAGFNNRQCTNSGGEIGFNTASSAKGSCGACLFIGQAVQFGIEGGSGQQRYALHTIAGLRTGSGGQPVRNLAEAKPKLIYQNGLPDTSAFPDGRTVKGLTNGLTFSWARYDNVDIGGYALISSVGEYSADQLSSGTQTLSLYPLLPDGMGSTVVGSAPPFRTDEQNFSRVVNPRLRTAAFAAQANPRNGIKLCFASGGTDQSALITVGGTDRALSVSQQIINGNRQCNR